MFWRWLVSCRLRSLPRVRAAIAAHARNADVYLLRKPPDVRQFLAQSIKAVPQMDTLAAISERNSSAFRHNFKAGKYRGGIPPWGYLPEQDDSGTWRLVQDPEQVRVI